MQFEGSTSSPDSEIGVGDVVRLTEPKTFLDGKGTYTHGIVQEVLGAPTADGPGHYGLVLFNARSRTLYLNHEAVGAIGVPTTVDHTGREFERVAAADEYEPLDEAVRQWRDGRLPPVDGDDPTVEQQALREALADAGEDEPFTTALPPDSRALAEQLRAIAKPYQRRDVIVGHPVVTNPDDNVRANVIGVEGTAFATFREQAEELGWEELDVDDRGPHDAEAADEDDDLPRRLAVTFGIPAMEHRADLRAQERCGP